MFGSLERRYGKYIAPFWLFGIIRPGTWSDMMSPIIGSGNPGGSATASAGGSTIMNARLRSATASAPLTTPGSQMPGTSSRLKIGILSSALSASKASEKSPGL